MIDRVINSLTGYFYDLGYILRFHWNHMTPEKYTTLLVAVCLFGYLLMKNGVRSH